MESQIYPQLGLEADINLAPEICKTRTKETDETAFWAKVGERAQNSDWQLVHEDGHTRQFERIVAATGEQVFHSAEEVRVAYNPETKTVTVAWVQADERQLPKHFPEGGPEGDFAKRVVWPKFGELVP